jgi:hypothetical protein
MTQITQRRVVLWLALASSAVLIVATLISPASADANGRGATTILIADGENGAKLIEFCAPGTTTISSFDGLMEADFAGYPTQLAALEQIAKIYPEAVGATIAHNAASINVPGLSGVAEFYVEFERLPGGGWVFGKVYNCEVSE